MNKRKVRAANRLLAMLLTVCMLMSGVSMDAFAAAATSGSNLGTISLTPSQGSIMPGEAENVSSGEAGSVDGGDMVFQENELLTFAAGTEGTEAVTRAQWLAALTETFEMSVTEDNYPDNYFTDIDSTSEDYYTIMLATEFGLIDVAAGEAVRPNDVATREFAAYTLNVCLGYTLEEQTYTFSESATVTYPDEIQIAINQGNFALVDGAFLPEQAVTAAEQTAIMEYAAAIVESMKIDPDYESTYAFAEGVIEIPSTVVVELTDSTEVTLYQYTGTLAVGDKFGVVNNGFPVVYRALAVSVEDGNTVVEFETVSMEEAFTAFDVEGGMTGDLTQVQAYDESVTLSYIVGGTAENQWEDGEKYESLAAVGSREISAVEATKSYELSDGIKKDFNLADGVKATISCTISNIESYYDTSYWTNEAYVGVGATVTFNCNVSMDVLEAAGVESSVTLLKTPVCGLGYMDVTLKLKAKGELTLSMVENIYMGVEFYDGQFRSVRNFNKKAFTIQAQAEITAGIKASVGVNACNILKGEIYAEAGAGTRISVTEHGDGKLPARCTHVEGWLYAAVGYNASVDVLLYEKSWSGRYDFITRRNSPVKVAMHYDDGVPVSICGREVEIGEDGTVTPVPNRYKYYTPINSKYAYSGASKGTGSDGKEYTIFEYEVEDGGATITKYQGNVSALSIPKTLDGYTVTGIGANVFKDNKQLRIVVIPDSVLKIEEGAFSGCTNLSSVTLSKKVTEIGYRAFYNCDSLTSIEIPKSLDTTTSYSLNRTYYIGVFDSCDNLTAVSFEQGTTEIAENLFANCTGLKKIEIPNTVTVIENEAFYNCINLSEVKIPNSVTEIHASAFKSCVALKTIEIPYSVISLGASSFASCTWLESVSLPNSLITIGDNCFANCAALQTMVIPDSVLKIEERAFSGCKNLSSVTLSKKVTEIGYEAFYNCDSLTSIEIPKSLDTTTSYSLNRTYYIGVFDSCDNLTAVSFEQGTTEIAENLFANCTGLKKIEIPNTVTVIENEAFYNCINLSEVIIPNSVTEIQSRAFEDCVLLKEIVIPDSVTNMGTYIFSGCTSLTKAQLPAIRQNITEGTFYNCNSLEDVNWPEALTAIRTKAFYNCSSLKKANIPQNVTIVEAEAFRNCTSLETLTLGESLQSIKDNAFNECDTISEVIIPDSVTSLGTYAFAYCDKLSTLKLGTGLTTIPSYAFYECPAIVEITLPYRITTVNTKAFANCTGLTKMTIPRGTTSISADAFSYPAKMTVYGISGTYAETFATEQGMTFVNQEVAATAVSLSATELTLNKGTTQKLSLTVTPENFTDAVVWRTNNADVATIAEDGTVTAKGVGSAIIKVTVGNVSASCNVTVVQPVTSISLNSTKITLEALKTYQLTATVYPSNAANKTIQWSSSDPKVASVDENGLVTAQRKGTATITVAAQDGSDVTRTCTVTVSNNGYLCAIPDELESAHNYEVNCSDVWLFTQQGAESLVLTFDERTELEDGFDYLYIYTKTGTLVGKYTGKELAGQQITVSGDSVKIQLDSDEAGTAWGFKVTDISFDGQVKSTAVALSHTTATISEGKTLQLTTVLTPSNSTDAVAWSTSDENVATVSGTGLVTAVKKGSAVITATTTSGKTASCTITVTESSVDDEGDADKPGGTGDGDDSGNTEDGSDGTKDGDDLTGTGDGDDGTGEDVTPDDGKNGDVLIGDIPAEGIPQGLWIAGIDADGYTYTGKAIKPVIRVYDYKTLLKEKVDYTISYKNNTKANDGSVEKSAPTILVKGKGNYKDKESITFKINPIDISGSGFAADDMAVAFKEGKTQKPVPVLLLNGKKLKAKKDYTASYNDTLAGAYSALGTYTITLTGNGNYTGSRKVNLTITNATLMSKLKVTAIPKQTYQGGKPIEPVIEVKNGKNVVAASNYEIRFENNTEIGTASVLLTGKGKEYVGTKRVTFKIEGVPMSKVKVDGMVTEMIYTGTALKQKNLQISYTDKSTGAVKKLAEGVDYEVTYLNHVKAGKATLILTGIGAYSGSVKKTYKITPYDIGSDASKLLKVTYDAEQPFAKGGSKPKVTVSFNGRILKEKTDYTVSFKDNKAVTAGTSKLPTIILKGKGNFKGTRDADTFRIVPKDMAQISVVAADKTYAEKAGNYTAKVKVLDTDGKALKAGSDYDKNLRYVYEKEVTLADGTIRKANEMVGEKDIVPVGAQIRVEVTGMGSNYTKTVAVGTYRIIDKTKDLSKAKITVQPQVYTGKAVKPGKAQITVTLQGKTLTANDYEIVGYTNNVKNGKATVTIRGVGEYGGTKSQKFSIGQRIFNFLWW